MGWDGTLTSPLAPQVRGVPGVDPRGALSQLGQLHGPRAGQHQALLLLHHRYEARWEAQSLRSSLPHPQLPACVRESSARAPSPVPTSTPPARSRLRWFTAQARLPPSPPLPLNTFFSLSSIPKIKPCSSPLGVRSPPPFPGADTHRSAGTGAGRLRRTNPALSAAGRAQCGACSPRAPALQSATVCAPGKQGRGAGGSRVLCCLPGSLAARCHPVPAAPAPAPSRQPAPLSPGFDSFLIAF